jgi:hypothetical protein
MSEIQVNTINEYTGANGVTIDGALIKDSQLAATAGGGLVRLETATASDSPTFTFDDFVDNSTYSYYKLIIEEIVPATDSAVLHFVFRSGGASGADMTGTYRRSGSYEYMDLASHAQYSNGSDTDYSRTAFNYGNSTNENFSSEVTLYPNNGQSLSKGIHEYIGRRNSPYLIRAQDNFILDNATAMTGIKIEFSSGNITSGKATVYGVKR